jgi:hypothetical protein
MINQGIICSDIAKKLNISKPHVSYYISKAKKKNLVKETLRDTFKSIQITQAGQNFLDQYEKDNPSVPICRAENIRFKATVTRMPTVPVDWKKIQMNNWVQHISEIDSVKVKLNMGKIPTIEFIPSPIEGENPFDLYATLLNECNKVAEILNERIGLEVDKLQSSSRGEWLTHEPIARKFCKHIGQVTYNGIGKINASKPREIGEFEFHDPRALKDYLLMPYRLKNIEDIVGRVLELLEQNNSSSEILD